MALSTNWALNASAPLLDILPGTRVSWTAANAASSYQPQSWTMQSGWMNLGTAMVGNSISSVFSVNGATAYRVVETTAAVPGPSQQYILSATAAPGLEISWQTKFFLNYQVESSTGLPTFGNFGPVISGDGSIMKVTDLLTAPARFYRVSKSISP